MLKSFTAIANAIRTAVGGLLQVTGPSAGTTRTMTVPDANFTAARTDAGQTFTGNQTINGMLTTAYIAKQISYTDGDATPSVSNGSLMLVANSSPTSITNFDDGVSGQIIVLKFEDSNTTITRDNAYLAGGTNFTSTAHDTLTLIKLSSFWFEVSRSANS